MGNVLSVLKSLNSFSGFRQVTDADLASLSAFEKELMLQNKKVSTLLHLNSFLLAVDF